MDIILTFNVGSSSLKFAIFSADDTLNELCYGDVDSKQRTLSLYDQNDNLVTKEASTGADDMMHPKFVLEWIQKHYPNITIKAAGHRVVHGGPTFMKPIQITSEVISGLRAVIPLAPLHIPAELNFIEKVLAAYPTLTQVACFDTAFHSTQPRLAKLFAIPRKYADEGIIRYGFHGLSYEYISSQLLKIAKPDKLNRVVVAHLGNGASACAIKNGKSISTTMGLSALDGLVMGTRCGNVDPGLLLYLGQEKGFSFNDIQDLLYKQSGLLGVSGISSDVRTLLASKDPHAKEALDLFCYIASIQMAGLISDLQGIDTLVFTAGIGENAAPIRAGICERLKWLGISIDSQKNQTNAPIISTDDSKIVVRVLETNEELMIAKHTLRISEGK